MNHLEQNKAVVRDFIERINAGDLEGGAAHVAEDLVNHAAIPSAQGRAGLVTIFTKLRVGFPDLKLTTQEMMTDGDKVIVRGKMTGTNSGPINMAVMPFPATGKSIEVDHIHIYRVAGGQIVEHWGARDDFGMLRQLGLLEKLR